MTEVILQKFVSVTWRHFLRAIAQGLKIGGAKCLAQKN